MVVWVHFDKLILILSEKLTKAISSGDDAW